MPRSASCLRAAPPSFLSKSMVLCPFLDASRGIYLPHGQWSKSLYLCPTKAKRISRKRAQSVYTVHGVAVGKGHMGKRAPESSGRSSQNLPSRYFGEYSLCVGLPKKLQK
jgi:hypothetical protein